MNSVCDVPPTSVEEPAGALAAEQQRLAALHRYEILDTPPEPAFDDIAFLASVVCNAPVAMVSLVGADRQWAKALTGPGSTHLSRGLSFCTHAIVSPQEVFEVQDATRDPRFVHNTQVSGANGIRFYAGAPLVTPSGHAIGTLAVQDHQPRQLDERQRHALRLLARQVIDQLERRRLALLVEAHGIVDGATPVGSPRALDRRLAEEWQRHARRGESLGLLLIELSPAQWRAPEPPLTAASLLDTVAGCLRSSDYLARLDENRLAALLPTSGVNASMQVAQRMRQAIDKALTNDPGNPVRLGVASMIPNRSGQPHQLIERAMHALARVGRSRVEAFSGW
ncbi:GGDEF domain-containing protein [Hydrogenophaga aquatica]